MTYLAPLPKMQFFTAAGTLLVGGKLYSYAAGTTTPLATYTDYGGATPNTNPVILDSRGEASVWLGSSSYKFKLTDPTGTEIWTVDNITGNNNFTTILAQLAASSGSSLIGFIQAGAGATARTVQSKLRDVVSVLDFGADPTGVSDSTSAMQNAHNTGKLIYYPAGSYKFTSITMSTGGIVGDGPDQTVLTPSGTTGNVIVCSSAPNSIGPVFQNFQIQPLNTMTSGTLLTIKCSDTTQVTSYAYVNNVAFLQNYFAGLLMQNSIQYSVSNCRFLNYSDAGFTSEDLANADAGDATIYGCIFNCARTSGNRNGLVWKSGGGLRIENNKFLGGQNGIFGLISYNTAAADLFIVGNSIENMAYAGIYLARAGGYTGQLGGVYIHGNNIANDIYNIFSSNAGYTGINISGNTFYSYLNNSVQVGLDGFDNSIITGNVFNAAGGLTGVNGIAIGSSNTYGRITGNVYRRLNNPYTNASATTIVDEHRQFGSSSAATSTAYGSLYIGFVNVTFAVPFAAAPIVTATLKDGSGIGGVSAAVSSVSASGFTAQVIGVTNSVTLPFNWNASGVVCV